MVNHYLAPRDLPRQTHEVCVESVVREALIRLNPEIAPDHRWDAPSFLARLEHAGRELRPTRSRWACLAMKDGRRLASAQSSRRCCGYFGASELRSCHHSVLACARAKVSPRYLDPGFPINLEKQ